MSATRNKAGVVLTMGTFDGVHRGHQAILRKTVERATSCGLSTLAVTFEQPPRLFFFPPKHTPCLLTLLPEKIDLLKRGGIQRVQVLPFNKAMATMSQADFFSRYFVSRFNAREIVVGYNFGFGQGRKGDTRYLETEGRRRGIAVHVVAPISLHDVPISSGQIRQHLLDGDVAAATAKLGYPYFLSGRVVPGEALGRRLGYPTANLLVDERKIAPPGVFAVRATLPDGKMKNAICNIGTRPTVDSTSHRVSIEVHLLDFRGELIGKTLRISLESKIRIEKKFASFEALAAQLRKDEVVARRFFAKT